jgi:hypothetical protein
MNRDDFPRHAKGLDQKNCHIQIEFSTAITGTKTMAIDVVIHKVVEI